MIAKALFLVKIIHRGLFSISRSRFLGTAPGLPDFPMAAAHGRQGGYAARIGAKAAGIPADPPGDRAMWCMTHPPH
jgi:hypothetical protein